MGKITELPQNIALCWFDIGNLPSNFSKELMQIFDLNEAVLKNGIADCILIDLTVFFQDLSPKMGALFDRDMLDIKNTLKKLFNNNEDFKFIIMFLRFKYKVYLLINQYENNQYQIIKEIKKNMKGQLCINELVNDLNQLLIYVAKRLEVEDRIIKNHFFNYFTELRETRIIDIYKILKVMKKLLKEHRLPGIASAGWYKELDRKLKNIIKL